MNMLTNNQQNTVNELIDRLLKEKHEAAKVNYIRYCLENDIQHDPNIEAIFTADPEIVMSVLNDPIKIRYDKKTLRRKAGYKNNV